MENLDFTCERKMRGGVFYAILFFILFMAYRTTVLVQNHSFGKSFAENLRNFNCEMQKIILESRC